MGVMRLGYVHTRVTDLDDAKRHYGETLGMKATHEADGRVYYKAWDETDHHSVVLEQGGVGLVKMGYKVSRSEDLDLFEKRAQDFGCLTERMSRDDNVAIGDGVRIVLPSEHVLELYSEAEYVGSEVGLLNPSPFPRHLVGVGVPRIDHCLVTAEDPVLLQRFFADVLDFRAAEQVREDPDDEDTLMGSWMSCTTTPHDVAFIKGPNGKLHHFAFELSDWYAIKNAGVIFTMDEVPVDIGPTVHGITRGETVYFFDPSGNRNEVFSGGYHTFEDTPTKVWSADQLGTGIFYVGRELSERFVTVLT